MAPPGLKPVIERGPGEEEVALRLGSVRILSTGAAMATQMTKS